MGGVTGIEASAALKGGGCRLGSGGEYGGIEGELIEDRECETECPFNLAAPS